MADMALGEGIALIRHQIIGIGCLGDGIGGRSEVVFAHATPLPGVPPEFDTAVNENKVTDQVGPSNGFVCAIPNKPA